MRTTKSLVPTSHRHFVTAVSDGGTACCGYLLLNRTGWRSSNVQWSNCKSATRNSRRKSAA